MRSEYLGDVARLARPGVAQLRGRREVACLSCPPRQRPVGNRPQQRLQKYVLAALRGSVVVVARQDLLGDQAVQGHRHLGLGSAAERRRRGRGERLTEHRHVLDQRPLGLIEAVQARGDQRLQRLWHLEVADVAGHHVARALLHQQPAILQHPDRLDHVERDSLSALDDLAPQILRQAGREPIEDRLGAIGARGCQDDRVPTGAPSRRAPSGPAQARRSGSRLTIRAGSR